MCQIWKISSSLFGTLGHKQSRRWDFPTYPNFLDHFFKWSIKETLERLKGNCTPTKISIINMVFKPWPQHKTLTFLEFSVNALTFIRRLKTHQRSQNLRTKSISLINGVFIEKRSMIKKNYTQLRLMLMDWADLEIFLDCILFNIELTINLIITKFHLFFWYLGNTILVTFWYNLSIPK